MRKTSLELVSHCACYNVIQKQFLKARSTCKKGLLLFCKDPTHCYSVGVEWVESPQQKWAGGAGQSQLDVSRQRAQVGWKARGICCYPPAPPAPFLLGSFPDSLFQACSTAWLLCDPRAGPGTEVAETRMTAHRFSLSRSIYYVLYSLPTSSNFPSLS